MMLKSTSVGTRRVVLLGIVVSAVLVVAGLLATGLGRDPTATASPLVGRAAPDFTLPGVDGPAVQLSKLRGQVVVVNFWASWCTECHTEQPALNATWQRFRDSGVVVVGVDFQDNTADARDYLAAAGSTYPVVEDADSRTALAYGVRGVPETFVLDRSGRVSERFIGAVQTDRLGDRISTLLRAGAQ
jgi:cytochrome c biogenesis protein CcmG/thiol:disulfide interchange protein DsbE